MRACETIGVLIILSSCLEPCTSTVPERPAKVPLSAFWCGGPDGGVYVRLAREPGKKNSYLGTIYTEKDGDIWYRGKFKMDPKDPGKPPKRGTSWCDSWDGTRLNLQGGGSLIALGLED